MKIVVAGIGYVGLSNAILLSQNNQVVAVDISQERVDLLNARKSPIVDREAEESILQTLNWICGQRSMPKTIIGMRILLSSLRPPITIQKRILLIRLR